MSYLHPSVQYFELPDNAVKSNSQVKTRFYEQDYETYRPLQDSSLQELQAQDAKVKRRIRILRVVSRLLATLLSIGIVVPLALTVAKFLQTEDAQYDVHGQQTSPWPDDPNTTYTYVYFGVSIVSLILNALVMVAYWDSVKLSNSFSTVELVWSTIIIITHLVIWMAAVGIYRYGKQKVDGKWKDLWGWTCGETANALQPFVKDINYGKYCLVQDISFYAGLVQVGFSLLTGVIFVYMILRTRTKKRLKNYRDEDGKELLRY